MYTCVCMWATDVIVRCGTAMLHKASIFEFVWSTTVYNCDPKQVHDGQETDYF